jgi:hypothetical protein
MTRSQFEAALAKVGFNKSSFSRATKINIRTIQRWGVTQEVPVLAVMLLNLMIDTEATPENLKP